MKTKRYASLVAIMATVAASAYAITGTSVLPQNVTSVDPRPDTRVNTGAFSSPLGVQQISVVFSKDVTINASCTEKAHIYKDGEETPIQSVGISGAFVDAMYSNIGGVLFPNSCTSNGNYRVTIPEGFWQLSGAGLSGAFDLYYEILTPQTISPSNSIQRELKEFRMEFPGFDEVKILDKSKFEFLRLSSSDTYNINVSEGINEDGSRANYILITLATPVTTQGEYNLFIQANAAEGISYGPNYPENPNDIIREPNTEVLQRYTVSLVDKSAINPAEGLLDKFTSFELTVPEGSQFWFVNDKAVNFIYPVNEDGSLSPDPICRLTGRRIEDTEKILLTVNENGNVVDSFTPKPGKYALQLASGLFSGSWDDEFINSSPYIYYYEIMGGSSVDEIPTPYIKADEAVYTIDGRKVSDSKESLREKTLPKGIYISGGHKIMITTEK